MTITSRDFIRHISKYLKVGEYVVTKHGHPHLVVTITDYKYPDEVKVLNTKEEIKDAIATIKINPPVYTQTFTPNYMRDTSCYGCGCKKVVGEYLCAKHGVS